MEAGVTANDNRNHFEMRKSTALLRLSSRLNACSEYEKVLTTICEETAKILGGATACLHIYEADETPALAAAYGVLPERVGLPFIHSFDVNGIAFVDRADLAGCFDNESEACRFISVKMVNEQQNIGILSLAVPGVDASSEMLREMLAGLADIAVAHIIKSRLLRDNRNQLDAITALYNNAQRLAQSLDIATISSDVCRTCVEAFDSPLAWLGKAESDGSIRVIGAYPDIAYPYTLTVRWDDTPAGRGPTGQAIRMQKPVYINDFHADERFDLWREVALKSGVESIAAFPLVSRGEAFGALMVYGRKTNFFSQEKAYYIQAYAHQAAAALQNAKLFEEAATRAACLQGMREIDLSITSHADLRSTLNTVLSQVISKLRIDAADIFLFNSDAKSGTYVAASGFTAGSVCKSRINLGRNLQSELNRKPDINTLKLSFLRGFARSCQRISRLAKEEGLAYYDAIPLVSKGKLHGFLEIFRCTAFPTDPEWRSYLDMLANQAVIAIDSSRLFNGLKKTNAELTSAYDATIEGWSRVLDMRDRETEGHSQRVAKTTVYLARKLGFNNYNQLVNIRRGSLLHDIGKMAIPDSILLKPGPLNAEEWKIMKKHPEYAYDMLSPISYLRPALDIPYNHHEKWDGTGYPRGLKGDAIPLPARIFAVVDVWDALSSDRPYRKAWCREDILEHIRSLSGSHFDPRIVKLFLENCQHIQYCWTNKAIGEAAVR